MIAVAETWLPGERPPLPRREKTPIYDEVAEQVATSHEPVWPEPEIVEPPTVEFAPVRPRRSFRRWVVDNLTVKRVLAGGASGLVLMASLAGRFFL